MRGMVTVASVAALAVTGTAVLAAGPAGASTAPLIGNGTAAYQPGSTSPPNQFNVLTLVTGGASAVNPSSLTVVSQPASGTATVTTTATSGIITYTPATATTGVQSLTFAYCAPGDTYPSAGNCTTATLTYRPSTGQWFGAQVEGENVVEQIENAVTMPATVVHGSTLSMTVAPVASNVPSSDSGDGITVTVYNASQFSEIVPVPKGLTYVPGSVTVTGGDATTSGNVAATYCTAPVSDACSAHIDSGDYKTTYPYLQTYLNPNTTVTGGDNVTMPTLSAEFTATGSAGTVVPADLTEYILNTDVSYVGEVTFDGYPSCSSCGSGSNAPTYAAPVPQATTTITPAPTVSGVDPNTGTPAGGTSVVITGSDLANAASVDFGSIPGTITADSATSITATSPPGTGSVDITVTTPDGTSAISAADQFTYGLSVPPPTLTGLSPTGGPVTGGTSVTVTGDNLANSSSVDFGPGNPGTITADSSSSVTATSPSGTGTVDVTVTTPSGTTVPSAPDQFAFGTPVLTKLSSWTDTKACGAQSTISAPALASEATLTASGGVGGGGGGALYSTSGGAGGAASSVAGTVPVTGGEQLTAVTGCAGATAPDDADVAATGGAGGAGFSNGGAGGNGYYCVGVNVEGECLGEGGADGSGGGGGGSSAVCSGTSCQAGGTPLVVAGGGGGGGESTLPGSDGGPGGAAGSGSSTSSTDTTGAGPSGGAGATGATDIDSGNAGGAGGVNSTGDSAGGSAGGNGSDAVSAGESAANGGGGGGYVGGAGSTDDTAEDGGAGGGGGAGSSWIVNNSNPTFRTSSAAAAVTAAFYGFVGTGPSVTTQPTGQTADAGQPATFTAAASGNPVPAVQWQVSIDGGTTFADILGATSTSYTVTAEPSESGNQYQAVFTNSVGAVSTDPASLTVDTLPVVATNPASETVNQGKPATFTAAGTGTPAPTVQWQVSTDGGKTFTGIAGATSPTYTFTTAAGDNGNQYEAAFTNSVGTVDSTPATLTLRTLPVVTTQPKSTSAHERTVAHFTAAATGYPTPTVQWQVSTNGTTYSAIKGATATAYSLTATAALNHHRYRAVFTNADGSTDSAAATLTVTAAVPVKITTTSLHSGQVYRGTKVRYSVVLTASGGVTPYTWSLASGKLPPGLDLSSSGAIYGKAAAAGTSTFVVKVVDTKTSVTPQTSATKQLSITIT